MFLNYRGHGVTKRVRILMERDYPRFTFSCPRGQGLCLHQVLTRDVGSAWPSVVGMYYSDVQLQND